MTKKRDYELPPVRIEPTLFAGKEWDIETRAAAWRRGVVAAYLDGEREEIVVEETRKILRVIADGASADRQIDSQRKGTRRLTPAEAAAIGFEHARLVFALMKQDAPELGAIKRATRAIAEKLHGSVENWAIKAVQRPVASWRRSQREEDGFIDYPGIVEMYEAGLAALDARRGEAPGAG